MGISIQPTTTTTLTDSKISISNQGALVHLEQIDAALMRFASDPACAGVLSAAAALREAAGFIDATTARALDILRKHGAAVQTASEVAQAAVPLTGHHSPNERVTALAVAGETIAQAFWRKSVAEVVAARQAKADELCDACVVSIEQAKLRIATAHAKLAIPLALRTGVTADEKAMLDQLRIELEADKPSALEQLVKTFQAVNDDERATAILQAVIPVIRSYDQQQGTVAMSGRIGWNVETERAAIGRLKDMLSEARRSAIPQSLREAEAGYERLFPVFSTIFSRRVDAPENLRADPNWLTLALGKAPSGFGR